MKKSISIIGGGPSSLMLAATIDTKKFNVTIYERNHTPGRKFLVAGKGGFNLTHSEEVASFINRYSPSSFFSNIILAFSNSDLQKWLDNIGIPTYTGTSKRIFPIKGIKPIHVLKAFLKIADQKKIDIKTHYHWKGWTTRNQLLFNNNSKEVIVKSDITIFALGGASWKITGSDGSWLPHFQNKGITTIPFQPSNCSFEVKWPTAFLNLAEGKSLKNISIEYHSHSKKGELIITKFGLEGNAIYALSPDLRKDLAHSGSATIFLDLKPSWTLDILLDKIKHRGNKSITKQLNDELNINEPQLFLLKSVLSKAEFTNYQILANKIKRLPILITGIAPIDKAISTVGGIDLNEIDANFELKKFPNHFVIGEMLDWDAPTGGYLLQGCFSMGYSLANHLNKI